MGYILIILSMLFTSCIRPSKMEVAVHTINERVSLTAQEFKYKDHSYIYFQKYVGRSATAGIVHDPDCQCFNN